MLAKLIDLVVSVWESITPVVIVQQTDAGVILRFGIFNREIAPGLRWKIPCVEYEMVQNVVTTTMLLQSQTLTTKDDKSIVITPIVKYSITDVKAFLLEIWDAEDVLNDVTLGAVKRVVSSLNWSDIIDAKTETTVLNKVRLETKQYGFEIEKVTFADVGRIKSIRLLNES